MHKEVISKEAAQKEIREFLIDNSADALLPEEGSDGLQFNKLVKDMQSGRLTIADNVISKTLKHPPIDSDGKVVISKLVFGKRLTMATRNKIIGGMKKDDQKAALDAIIQITSELTGASEGVIGKIDAEDAKIVEIITGIFFM